MKLGTNEPKKVVFLAVLAAAAGYLVYSNFLSSPSPGVVSQPEATPAAAPVDAPAPPPRPALRGGSQSDDFHPILHSKRPENRIDFSKVDPTLRLDLLAKLQVKTPPAARNLFQFGSAPAPAALKGPEPRILPKPVAVKPASGVPVSPGAPPPPSIPLKYYGFTSAAPGNSPKTAFFLDGDEILVGKEGDTLKRRYRVVRISPNTVVMEDTQSKHEQTLHMEDMPG